MAWTRGRLLFENVPLAKAVAEVNRYSKDVRIELADPRLEQLRVSGSYLAGDAELVRSEEHTSELQSLMRISYAVFCLKKKIIKEHQKHKRTQHIIHERQHSKLIQQ